MTAEQEKQLAELTALRNATALAATGAFTPPPGMVPVAPSSFNPQPSTPIRPLGLSVPMTVATPSGEATVYLEFGPEAAANPPAVIQQLMQAGWPVKTWQPKPQGGGGGWGGGGRRGGGW